MKVQEIAGAVARGWCHPKTQHLVMDTDLAWAIVEEVQTALLADREAYLGCATTAELLEELKVRAFVGGYSEYRTVDA